MGNFPTNKFCLTLFVAAEQQVKEMKLCQHVTRLKDMFVVIIRQEYLNNMFYIENVDIVLKSEKQRSHQKL